MTMTTEEFVHSMSLELGTSTGRCRGHLDIVVCPHKLEIFPHLPTERSPAKRTSSLSYHTVHLHPGYRAKNKNLNLEKLTASSLKSVGNLREVL